MPTLGVSEGGPLQVHAPRDLYLGGAAMRPALALLLLVGCVPEPAFVTPKYDINVFDDYTGPFFTAEIVDTSAARMVEHLAELGYPRPLLRRALWDTSVVTYPRDWLCPEEGYPERRCAGVQINAQLAVSIAWVEDGTDHVRCVWETALMHEMAHRMLQVAAGDPDDAHARRDIWPEANKVIGECQ